MIAIDPGTLRSAWVEMDSEIIRDFGYDTNVDLIGILERCPRDVTVIEMIASYGMAVGAEVFVTCLWIGRFDQATGRQNNFVYRKDVKLHFCGSMKAKDGNVRQAIIDRYGGKDKAIGKKKSPGPLYGISGDIWQALAVGLYYYDTHKEKI